MDPVRTIIIPLQGNQYILEVIKKKRVYNISEFGQYSITLRFKNYINQVVLEITTTEKEYFNMIQSMNYFCCDGTIYSDIIHLESSILPYFIYIFQLDNNHNIENESPQEEEWAGISIYQGNENNQGAINRFYLEITYYNLEELLYQLFTVIADIPYLDSINDSFLNDIFDRYTDAESYQRYVYNLYKGE